LATVIVGGLFIGPIMLLVVVPALCLVFLGKRDADSAGSGRGPSAPQRGDSNDTRT
jgi:cobalt-zinc-cadmium resistance protein CzcA